MNENLSEKNSFYFAILEVTTRIKKYEKKIIRENNLDITPKMLTYISLIDYHPNINQKMLINFLDVSKGTLSNMVHLLMQKKYLEQVINEDDKRLKILKLTKKGKEISKLNDQIRLKIKEYISTKLSDEELKTFKKIAYKLR